MCSGSKAKLSSSEVIMEDELQKNVSSLGDHPTSILLELSAVNDLDGFKHAIEEEGRDLDEVGRWYGIKIGLKKMGFEERTPLMIAALFGSMDILKFILQTGQVDVNRASGSDGATALHCATAGGSLYSHEVVKLLVDSGADVNQVDCNGNRPVDVISSGLSFSSKLKRKTLDTLLNKGGNNEEPCLTSDEEGLSPKSPNDGNGSGSEKKEYPVDPSLPDIKNGIYGTDEFRMYTFKVKPCSRAYSHDWTECPFVHPGENARRRDPRKYHYSCVPCPEFRKGACPKGDTCEYAHGIFECWLHPAQYRTRLCKDETKCARRVCFFAHKPDELRPLYASTGSAVPSPRSYSSAPSFDVGPLSPLSLGSPYMMMPSTSTPPMTPTGSSPIGGTAAWQNHLNIRPPPALQLPGSRLKAALCARDMNFETELHRQQLLDELAGLSMSSPTSWARSSELGRLGGLKPTNLDDMFGSLDPSMLSQVQSPTGMQTRQSINQQLCSSYSSGMPSSPVRGGSPLSNMESCGSPFSNARLASFANRSQSFIDRSTINRLPGRMPAHLSDWGSSDGQVEWGVQGDELNQLRKSASFGFRSNGNNKLNNGPNPENEPDVSWVNSLVKDAQPSSSSTPSFEDQVKQQYYLNSGGSEMIPAWVEQLYMEQEPMAA